MRIRSRAISMFHWPGRRDPLTTAVYVYAVALFRYGISEYNGVGCELVHVPQA